MGARGTEEQLATNMMTASTNISLALLVGAGKYRLFLIRPAELLT
jgi:hypothetical protein